MDEDEFEKDIAWLRQLHKRSWEDRPPRYSRGRITSTSYTVDLGVSKEDAERVIELFAKHRDKLLFEPSSGVFGFGVSISAGLIIWPPYPGIPLEIDPVITMTSKQLFPNERAGERALVYKVLESFTHTEENQTKRKEAGIKEPLKSYSYYDY